MSPTAPPVPLEVMVGVKVMAGLDVALPPKPPAPPVPLPVAVLSPLALLAVWLPLLPPVPEPVALTSPLVPPVALDEPELVMLIEGVEPEPLLEPRPTT